MRVWRRRLPHEDTPGIPTFVTFRLHGSLPRERVFNPEAVSSGHTFVAFDRLLDAGTVGPLYLSRPEIAELVKKRLDEVAADGLCAVHSWVAMPNHVHVFWTSEVSLSELMRRIKGTTAFEANRILGQCGRPFWQDEYFDRTLRNPCEFSRVKRYIEWNPVRAGLAASPEEFQWSSAWRR